LGDEKALVEAIWKNLLSIYGEISASDSKLYMVEFDHKNGRGILQCTEPSLIQVLAAAALIESVSGERVSFQPLKTSGTIRGLR
jgi:RNase P/RNase MRP subunit POP5